MLILVTGAPGTGKTTIGRKISAKFNVPFISRDDIKEQLFDVLGYSDRDWSRKVGTASWAIFHSFIEEIARHDPHLVAESNFQSSIDDERMCDLKIRIFQIHCIAKSEIVIQRFSERAYSGNRHPGHVDEGNLEEMRQRIENGIHCHLRLKAKLFTIDTTDFRSIDYDTLYLEIQLALNYPAH